MAGRADRVVHDRPRAISSWSVLPTAKKAQAPQTAGLLASARDSEGPKESEITAFRFQGFGWVSAGAPHTQHRADGPEYRDVTEGTSPSA